MIDATATTGWRGRLAGWLAPWHVPSTRWAALLLGGGMAGIWLPNLGLDAVALECVVTAFWLWSRRAEDAELHVRRWSWLRRPAAALWLAFALAAVSGGGEAARVLRSDPMEFGVREALQWGAALATWWCALELLSAPPFLRPYPDWIGPHARAGSWLPLVLPLCGLAAALRASRLWVGVPGLGPLLATLLLSGALLAVVRAFARPVWTGNLRWLACADASLAAALLALGRAPVAGVLLLLVAAFGTRALLLASEARGADMRRTRASRALWRFVSWLAGGGLAWAVGLELTDAGGGFAAVAMLVAPLVGALGAWITVRRLVAAPERRAHPRSAGVPIVQFALGLGLTWCALAGLVLVGGRAIVAGGGWAAITLALLLGVAGAAPRLMHRIGGPVVTAMGSVGGRSRSLARAAYHALVRLVAAAVGMVGALGRALLMPLRDLHTGEAQEYLLLLLAFTVVAMVLPLLR
jgi:hypothetical protein